METHPNLQDREIPSPNSSSGSSSNNHRSPAPTPATPPTPPPKPPTPRSVDANPYPTTFVQADTSSFKHVVQMLTGSAETAAKHAASNPKTSTPPPPSPSPTTTKPPGPKKPAFKLYERRSSMKNLKMISPLGPAFLHPGPGSPITAFSPRKQPEILSPSMLDFPSLVLSPVTPLIPDPFNRSPAPSSASSLSAEDRAIAEKGFYLHPSPRSTPRDAEPPRLLPLFPVTSPRISP